MTVADANLDDLEFDLLLQAVRARWGHDFQSYSRASLKRRVLTAVKRQGASHISALIHPVLRDPGYFAELLSSLCVSVTEFFRDPEFFGALHDHVLPHLAAYPRLKIWHAGCASGEEVYSLAILLQEAGLLHRTQIYATDTNLAALATARSGVYPLSAVEARDAAYRAAGGQSSVRQHCVTLPGTAASRSTEARCLMSRELRERITWSAHHLGTDGTFSEVNLIVCRNTLIYFDRSLQDRVVGLFLRSLLDGGFLTLGAQESLEFSAHGDAFDLLLEPQIYQRRALHPMAGAHGSAEVQR
ncbi:MAG: protein-glutamate O-methyltransferase CheR [Planctomycetota bacterium]